MSIARQMMMAAAGGAGEEEWLTNLSTASYDGVPWLHNQSSSFGLDISPDGANLYIYSRGTDRIHSFIMNTPYDVSNVQANGSFLTASRTNSGLGLKVSPDGSTIAMTSNQDNKIYQYSMSTPFSVSGLTYSGFLTTPDNPYDLQFNQDGSELFVLFAPATIRRYTTVTPFSVLGATSDLVQKTFSLPSGASAFQFSTDGKLLYIILLNQVLEFSMANPYDIVSAVSTGEAYSFNSSGVYGARFSLDGAKLITHDLSARAFYQHSAF